jgi:glycosyltransferase involved in cell wall biosynthesis
MHIAWISIAVPAASAGQGPPSALASVRYRMLQPKTELERLGHRVSLIDPRSQDAAEAARSADALIFGKLMAQSAGGGFGETADAYARLLGQAKGPAVLFDVNDDYFDVPGYGDFYRSHEPHGWVTSTGALAEVLAQFARAPIHVVPEPYEGPVGNPKPPARAPASFLTRLLRLQHRAVPAELLWFGHPTSLPELAASVEEVAAAARTRSLHLRCITAPGHGAEELCRSHGDAGQLRMSFEAWSPNTVWNGLEACDLVVLPAKLSRRLARAKSANRMVEALRAGRFALAHPRPAYLELAPYSWVGESLAAGIDWALAHPGAALKRIAHGQRHVQAEYSPGAIAQKWLGALQEARTAVH